MNTPFTYDLVYRIAPPVTNETLNQLFLVSWLNHVETNFQSRLRHSLTYVCAYARDRLVGFVNVAWDGGLHAFLLDTTVHPEMRRRGIGQQLVKQAAQEAINRGIEWLHVDYEKHLDGFYRGCGFVPTLAGLMQLQSKEASH